MELWERLFSPRHASPVKVWTGSDFLATDWGRLAERAERAGRALRDRGVTRGSRVGVVLTNGVDALSGLVGIWMGGAVPVSLPTPSRGLSPGDYARQLAGLVRLVEAPLLVVEERYRGLVPEAVGGARVVSFESLDADGRMEPDPPGPDAVAFVQFSSGSTADPKGCMLHTAGIAYQLERMASHLGVDPGRDVGAMWLPLSHDMGVFGGLLLAWFTGMAGVLSSPERFLVSPGSWLDDCARFGATVTAAPPMAIYAAAKAARLRPPSGRLSLRACVVGSERIDGGLPGTTDRVLGPLGFGSSTLVPAYGLAECTLAVTLGPLGAGPRVATVGHPQLLDGNVVASDPGAAGAIALASSGRPIPGTALRVRGEATVGELLVRSPSLTTGYLGRRDLSGERFSDGWLGTGDVGFVKDGETYVVGRLDDMISIGGRNVHLAEVETELARVPGLRRGGCAIVDTLDDGLVLVAEPTAAGADTLAATESARHAARLVADLSGAELAACIILTRGTLPKTPSGKVQRWRCRQLTGPDHPAVAHRIELR